MLSFSQEVSIFGKKNKLFPFEDNSDFHGEKTRLK